MVGRHVGKYRLVRQLGEGGMGVVYEGVREDIAQRAALKILRPEYATNPDLAGRFFNEARAANLIAHPGIVKVYDYGHNAGVAYLAMEYLEGESLWQRIERRGRIAVVDALRLARQIASALEAAHRVHIVHRDLKPDNVFIVADSEFPGGERAKLLDFGIAKMADEYRGSVRTQVNVIMGTPTYMAPEQCRGSKGVADKTDVYALGVMLFEDRALSGLPNKRFPARVSVLHDLGELPRKRNRGVLGGPQAEALSLRSRETVQQSELQRFRDTERLRDTEGARYLFSLAVLAASLSRLLTCSRSSLALAALPPS